MASQIPPWLENVLPPVPQYLPAPPNPHGMYEGPPDPMPTSVSYEPDYMALIEQDPAYAALKEAMMARGVSEQAQRQAATQQALIQFGLIPDFSGLGGIGLSPEAIAMLQADISPEAAALAQQNTAAGFSTQAQLQQGQRQAIMGLRNALAARGAIGSGDNAYRTGLQNQAYNKAQHDALQAVLAAVGGYQRSYLDQRNADQDKLNEGLQRALEFESSLPQNQGFTLRYDSKTGTYKDTVGNAYSVTVNSDGSWTLTGNGNQYQLDAFGHLTSGTYNPPAAPPGESPPVPVTPPDNTNTVPPPPVQPPIQNPPTQGPPGWPHPGHRPPGTLPPAQPPHQGGGNLPPAPPLAAMDALTRRPLTMGGATDHGDWPMGYGPPPPLGESVVRGRMGPPRRKRPIMPAI